MPRTTINKQTAHGCVAAISLLCAMLVMLAGCGGGEDYTRSEVGIDSAQGRQLATLIDQLPGGEDSAALDAYLAAHAAPGLNDTQRAGLRYALEQLAKAPGRQVRSLDRFGDDVYRCVIAGEDRKAAQVLLLVQVDGDLKWAGAN